MMKRYKIYLFAAIMGITACSSDEESFMPDATLEIKGIQATIDTDDASMVLTRATDETDKAANKFKIGRSVFAANDKIVFTTIRRTAGALQPFTYSNIHYLTEDGSSWERTPNGTTIDPEQIYWTDGSSPHTFIGYSLPQGYYWEKKMEDGGIDTYAGELGYNKEVIDYTIGNDALVAEDLLVIYSENTQAESDGLSTKVMFSHALSNVRVVVNIKNFAATASAVDTEVSVSDMMIYNQPVRYTWGADSESLTVVDFGASGQTTKDIKLWCPAPAGEGTGLSKTFTFYGLTTPQNDIFHQIRGNANPLQFSFKVTYPDAMNPSNVVEKVYHGSFEKVDFVSGKQTTLNISLNHKNEEMFTDVEYRDWNFVSTPDLGELRKKSTFMTMGIKDVTVHAANLSIDDATWLYGPDNDVKDIYGHSGDTEADAYVIKSAAQLLSLAKEVNEGAMDFEKKFIRLDADITMQKSTTDTGNVWQGIGTSDHPFQGTFLGGDRFINRLSGSGLFGNLGDSACVEQLQITTVGSIQGGALAVSNAGIIGGCRVVDDITTDGGALVGTNTGTVHACYCTGDIIGGSDNLIGSGEGEVVGCYIAREITSFTDDALNSKVKELNGALTEWYSADFKHTKYQFSHVPANYPVVQPLH